MNIFNFQACGDTCSNILMPSLKVLLELRDSDQFTFISELENTIGVAVKSMGPEAIIKIVPFQVEIAYFFFISQIVVMDYIAFNKYL